MPLNVYMHWYDKFTGTLICFASKYVLMNVTKWWGRQRGNKCGGGEHLP